ncbi:MAG: CRISPR-associated endonuclease Cas1 [Methylosarcina sp.]
MSTLYLDRKNLAIKLDGEAVALYENGERRGTVPLHMLERVVARGNVEFESRVFGAFGERKIAMMFLSGRNSRNQAMSFNYSHNDVTRRLAQFRAYFQTEHRFGLAHNLVKAKIHNQHQLLQDALAARPDLRRPLFSSAETLQSIQRKLDGLHPGSASFDQLRGFEGSASAAYFSAYTRLFPASLGFTKRVKRPPTDPVNACLSLGYTLLHFEAVNVCLLTGLEPLLGFYHEPAFGRESMACDLIEPVRSRLDDLVWRLFRERRLGNDHFAMDKGRCLLNKAGRKQFYAHYELFAVPVRRLLRLYGHRLAKDYLQTDWECPL